MSNDLVCQECGSPDFVQRRYAVMECGVRFDESHGEYDTGENQILDGGDRDEPIQCADCGEEVAYDHSNEGLITEEAYNSADEE